MEQLANQIQLFTRVVLDKKLSLWTGTSSCLNFSHSERSSLGFNCTLHDIPLSALVLFALNRADLEQGMIAIYWFPKLSLIPSVNSDSPRIRK